MTSVVGMPVLPSTSRNLLPHLPHLIRRPFGMGGPVSPTYPGINSLRVSVLAIAIPQRAVLMAFDLHRFSGSLGALHPSKMGTRNNLRRFS